MVTDTRNTKAAQLDQAIYIAHELDRLANDCLASNNKTGQICCQLALMAINILIDELKKQIGGG
ncbi:MAG: hypothetical protein WCP93_01965 [Candidatus Berkelbacteria bacterium]